MSMRQSSVKRQKAIKPADRDAKREQSDEGQPPPPTERPVRDTHETPAENPPTQLDQPGRREAARTGEPKRDQGVAVAGARPTVEK